MGTKRAGTTNKVSTFRAAAPAAAANVPVLPPDVDDIVSRLVRINARQQRIFARQQRIDARQERIDASQEELSRLMAGQIPRPTTQ